MDPATPEARSYSRARVGERAFVTRIFVMRDAAWIP